MSMYEKMEIIKAGAAVISFYGGTLVNRITTDLIVAEKVRLANGLIIKAQQVGDDTESQTRLIDATDPVASAFAGTNFNNGDSVHQFVKSEIDLSVGTDSASVVIRRQELIKNSLLALRNQTREVERTTRGVLGCFLKELVFGEDNEN